MKKLNELLEGVEVIRICGTTEREIGKVCFDSRQAGEGDLFVAQRGVSADGHAFIEKATGAGCRAVVCEELPSVPTEGVTYVVTGDSSEALGRIASNYYGRPSEALTLVGVTGTGGERRGEEWGDCDQHTMYMYGTVKNKLIKFLSTN